MDEDDRIIPGGVAVHQLVTALQACDNARLSFAEILEIVRPHLPEDGDITILGSLIEQVRDSDASTIIRIAYNALLGGATFSFTDRKRSREKLRRLCHEAGVENRTEITDEGRLRCVVIAKPPS